MSKKLLEESTIRQFMKLAELSPLSENFLEEKRRKKKGKRGMREENLEEMDDYATEEGHMGMDPMMEEGEDSLEEAGHKDKEKKKIEEEVLEEDNLDEEKLEEELDALFEEEALEEMGGYGVEEGEHEGAEMEAEAGDMEAEINISPDQARAIIAVADMLKDIMPDLDAPEMEDEMDMEEPEELAADDEDAAAGDMADADADLADAGEEAADEGEALEENETLEENDELAEAIMKKVKARLKEMKSK